MTDSTSLDADILAGDQKRQLSFHGNGGELFGILIVNAIFTVLTFGIYYPWAKAKLLKYQLSNTELDSSRFDFTGTGGEMFKGFIVAMGIVIGIVLVSGLLMQLTPVLGGLFYFVAISFFVGVASVGGLRYRMSRTSYKGISMGYVGKVMPLLKIFVIDGFLTLITFGIYGPWFIVKLYREIFGNIRLGNIRMHFEADGFELFKMMLINILLIVVTLYLYVFRAQSDLYKFMAKNIKFTQGTNIGSVEANTTGMKFFTLMIVNVFLIFITLGLATPWVIVRTTNFYFANTDFNGNIDLNNIEQTMAPSETGLADTFLDTLPIDFFIV